MSCAQPCWCRPAAIAAPRSTSTSTPTPLEVAHPGSPSVRGRSRRDVSTTDGGLSHHRVVTRRHPIAGSFVLLGSCLALLAACGDDGTSSDSDAGSDPDGGGPNEDGGPPPAVAALPNAEVTIDDASVAPGAAPVVTVS